MSEALHVNVIAAPRQRCGHHVATEWDRRVEDIPVVVLDHERGMAVARRL